MSHDLNVIGEATSGSARKSEILPLWLRVEVRSKGVQDILLRKGTNFSRLRADGYFGEALLAICDAIAK